MQMFPEKVNGSYERFRDTVSLITEKGDVDHKLAFSVYTKLVNAWMGTFSDDDHLENVLTAHAILCLSHQAVATSGGVERFSDTLAKWRRDGFPDTSKSLH